MIEDTRPIDVWMLIIESLVLAIIAGEAIIHAIGSRKSRSKNEHLLLKQQRLADFLVHARNLEISVPKQASQEDSHSKWADEVAKWNEEIVRYLAGECGAQASARFLTDRVFTISFGGIPPGLQAWMGILTSRRDNLTAILDRPDVYLRER